MPVSSAVSPAANAQGHALRAPSPCRTICPSSTMTSVSNAASVPKPVLAIPLKPDIERRIKRALPIGRARFIYSDRTPCKQNRNIRPPEPLFLRRRFPPVRDAQSLTLFLEKHTSLTNILLETADHKKKPSPKRNSHRE